MGELYVVKWNEIIILYNALFWSLICVESKSYI